jgi:hypothetical protein
MKRNSSLYLILAAVLVIVAAFFLVDFRLSQTSLATQSQTESYSFSVEEPNDVLANQALDLYVQAPERLRDELADSLVTALQDNPYASTVTLREEPLQSAAGSVLVVAVEEPSTLMWTPVYVRTDATVRFAYALDGEVAWIDVTPVVLESSDPPQAVVRLRGTMDLDGSGYGLFSRPGYASYLADELAGQISGLLEAQLAGTGG